MKLTKGIKTAVIVAIIDDVQQQDYKQQAQDLARKFFTAKLPPSVAKIAKSEHVKRLDNRYFTVKIQSPTYNNIHVCIPGGSEEDKLTEAELIQVQDLLRQDAEQDSKISELRQGLELSFAGLQTRAAFVKAFPEFEKYLPAEPDRILGTGLISTAVVTSLMEAGWPKGETS